MWAVPSRSRRHVLAFALFSSLLTVVSRGLLHHRHHHEQQPHLDSSQPQVVDRWRAFIGERGASPAPLLGASPGSRSLIGQSRQAVATATWSPAQKPPPPDSLLEYKEISRVQAMLYDTCLFKKEEDTCLEVWYKLTHFVKQAVRHCQLLGWHCVMLEAMERLCKEIKGETDLLLLQKVSGAVSAFRSNFADAQEAFKAADGDCSGDIDRQELEGLLKHIGCMLTDNEAQIIFHTIDGDDDGVISKEEFHTFLEATVFAEASFRELQPGVLLHLPPVEHEVHRIASLRKFLHRGPGERDSDAQETQQI